MHRRGRRYCLLPSAPLCFSTVEASCLDGDLKGSRMAAAGDGGD